MARGRCCYVHILVCWLLQDSMTRVTCYHRHHANEATQESCSGPCAVRPLQAPSGQRSRGITRLLRYEETSNTRPWPQAGQGARRVQTPDSRDREMMMVQVFPTPFPSPAIVPSLRRGQDLNITSMLESSQFIYHQEVAGRGGGRIVMFIFLASLFDIKGRK